ncbi:hypothetical protein ABWK22_01600 [Gottfriedia acidiceleris]|uniref:hypothetical protein n=1 Tax=Gottfriedia acidiceleris TaxID=371036 RepID=UPI0033925BDA
MNAFFSGTDDANENTTQFYGVWGKIKDKEPAFAFRYVSGDAKIKINPDVLFDWPKVTTTITSVVTSDVPGFESTTNTEYKQEIFKGPFPKIEYPSDWMEQHTARAEIKLKTAGGGLGRGASFPSNSYISRQDGGLDQIEWDYEHDPRFHNAFIEEDIQSSIMSGMTYGGRSGIEEAEIIKFMDLSDEARQLDIRDNIYDIAGEYSRLGYAPVMEAAMNGVKQNQI